MVGISVTGWVDYFSMFCHLRQWKFAQWHKHYKFAITGPKFCQILNRRIKNCPSGKIPPHMVTLDKDWNMLGVTNKNRKIESQHTQKLFALIDFLQRYLFQKLFFGSLIVEFFCFFSGILFYLHIVFDLKVLKAWNPFKMNNLHKVQYRSTLVIHYVFNFVNIWCWGKLFF